MVAQNGLQLETTQQEFVGPHWGYVTPFALEPDTERDMPIDPGVPSLLNDPVSDHAFRDGAVEVIEYS